MVFDLANKRFFFLEKGDSSEHTDCNRVSLKIPKTDFVHFTALEIFYTLFCPSEAFCDFLLRKTCLVS